VTTPLADQPFTDFPTVTPATPATEVPNWIFLRRAQVEGLARLLTPRSDFDKETMEALGLKLRAMESRITRGDAHATVVADFKAWIVVDSNDRGAWDYYKAWQQKHDGEVADAQVREAAAKAVSQARGRAGDAAAAQTRMRPTGLMASDGVNGRVIAGLALVGAPALSYFGISGTDMHAASSAAVDLVITELLKGTNQAEKWPQRSCAEVDALKRYLTAAGITSVANIPQDTLVFHAEVWHPGGSWNGKITSKRWQPRGACANCKQWVGKIGALLA